MSRNQNRKVYTQSEGERCKLKRKSELNNLVYMVVKHHDSNNVHAAEKIIS
jgi:hypothetical protein